jgi:hypothetical protein
MINGRIIKALPTNVAKAREFAAVVIDVQDDGELTVNYGSGLWKAIAVIAKTEFGSAIVSEICFGDQRPYETVRWKEKCSLIYKRANFFKLTDFCSLEKIMPIFCDEMQKITDSRTKNRVYRISSPIIAMPSLWVWGPRKGVSHGKIGKSIERGIIFSISELDAEFFELFLTGPVFLELTLNRLTKKIGQLLACKLYDDLFEFMELRHNIIWLHPILFELILIYGSQYLDREDFLNFLERFFWHKPKFGHSEKHEYYWDLWKQKGEDKIKNLAKNLWVKNSRELISIKYSLRRMNERKKILSIDVFPRESAEDQIIKNTDELEIPF